MSGPEAADADGSGSAPTIGAVDAPPANKRGRSGMRRGDQVGRYLVLSRLGSGGMGVVYAAHDPELDRKVALKLLRARPGRDTKGSLGHRRLLREAQAMARLNHPNVVTVHDVGEHDGRVFLAMELVDGTTLDEWLVEAPRSQREVLAVFRQAGEGLVAAHAEGLVHRDFKPQNVMVGPGIRPVVRVMDFGLVRSADSPSSSTDDGDVEPLGAGSGELSSRMTVVGAVMGTPSYMAPEQHLGVDATEAADQFAYCVALYRALFGVKPFAGTTREALSASVLAGEVREPRTAAAPAFVRSAILRGLAREPGDRWPSQRALLDALGRDPRPRRRAIAVAGVVLGGVALALGVRSFQTAGAERGCVDAGESIALVWNDEAGDRMREGMLLTGAPFADSAFVHTRPFVDAYADRWADQREAVCRRAVLDGTLDEGLRRRSIACLEGHRARFAALVDALSDPDHRMVQRSLTAVTSLPSVDACSDPRWLARVAPLTADAEADVLAVEADLGRALGLYSAQRYVAAASEGQRALDGARVLGRAPLTARAGAALGMILVRRGDGEEGFALLEEAFYTAAAAGADDVVLATATNMVFAVADARGAYDDSIAWGRLGEAWIERLGADGTPAHGNLLNALGGAQGQQGDLEAAQRNLERALQIGRETLGPDHPELCAMLNNLGVVREKAGDLGRALAYYEQSLRIWELALGEEHPAIASELNNIAIVKVQQGEPAEGERHWQRALDIRVHALGADHPRVASILDNLASLHVQRGRFSEALELNQRAIEIREAKLGPDHPALGTSMYNLGRIQRGLGDTAASLVALRRGKEIRERALGAEHPAVAATISEIGLTYAAMGEHERALQAHDDALAMFTAALGPTHRNLGIALKGKAAAYRELGDTAAAVAALERALRLLGHDATSAEADALRAQLQGLR